VSVNQATNCFYLQSRKPLATYLVSRCHGGQLFPTLGFTVVLQEATGLAVETLVDLFGDHHLLILQVKGHSFKQQQRGEKTNQPARSNKGRRGERSLPWSCSRNSGVYRSPPRPESAWTLHELRTVCLYPTGYREDEASGFAVVVVPFRRPWRLCWRF
jgi:hypothetical protein